MEINNMTKLIDEHILNTIKNNITKLPERMEKGLTLIFPEKREEYLDFLLDRAKIDDCYYIDNVLEVMQALEEGKTIEEAASLIKSPNSNFYEAKVKSTVLSYSKRGPEFFKGTLPCTYEELCPDVKNAIEKIEQENMLYAQNQNSSELTRKLINNN